MSGTFPLHEAILDGRYQLEEPIGSGGEARVYRARDSQTGLEVGCVWP